MGALEPRPVELTGLGGKVGGSFVNEGACTYLGCTLVLSLPRTGSWLKSTVRRS